MRRGVETIAAGRTERPYGTFTSYVGFDRTDEDQLRRTLDTVQPDVLLDLACYLPDEVSAVARNFKGERYIFISTGVYPHLHGKPAREEDFVPLEGDPPGSLDYFDGKRWCETFLARTRDFPWTVIRPPAIFGAADRTLRIAAYIQRVADGGAVLVPVESYQRQAGLAWVKDVGFACALASDPRKDATRKAYNVAFEGVSMRDLLEGIARALGVPARYVSGYFRGGEDALAQHGSHKAGHAWAEAHVLDLGWVGFDPANGVCTTDQHARVAVGLDYLGAAPVRGAHYGGGREDVAVRLEVTQASWQTQE